ncbi:MAG: CRISPR-associated helicase Cas3' [Ruminococcus sp.]|jgi:CRISPR-associated endonuclease/helicase Cas3|nr:CRISPR-associated helicase Cas3' [Ruminococcus sp.]
MPSVNDYRYLWAKKSRTEFKYLPVIIHLLDNESAVLSLYNRTLSDSLKKLLYTELGEDVIPTLRFIALSHDLGKISPIFQRKKSHFAELDKFLEDAVTGLDIYLGEFTQNCPHNLLSQFIAEKYGVDSSVSCILGGHHGIFGDSKDLLSEPGACGFNSEWESVQKLFFDYAVNRSEFNIKTVLSKRVQILFTGLLITADWLSSNEFIYPLIPADGNTVFDDEFFTQRNEIAEQKIVDIFKEPYTDWQSGLREGLIKTRFGFHANSFQKTVTEIASSVNNPGIMVLEAPMGCGKTEAALAAAEIFAGKTDASGLYFALPTQATSDGIFPRIRNWINKFEGVHNLQLSHGKAQFNEEYNSMPTSDIYDEDSGAVVESWMNGRKKSLLSAFAVGTIDRILKAAQRSKHVVLSHLGLSQKIVIIDECHAYDAYMNVYLERLLYYLGIYNVPVIILSATLPYKTRSALISAYKRKKTSLESLNYPLISYSDGDETFEIPVADSTEKKRIEIKKCSSDDIISLLKEKLQSGGSAAVIMNTVRSAQAIAEVLRNEFGEDVLLIHSRFLAEDRAKKERFLKDMLGRGGKFNHKNRFIVVGTQVIEQSLDIDFDLMISQICPMDLLLQRIGRLHRHNRQRPELLKSPICCVCDSESDLKNAEYIYKKYLLYKTESLLSESITLPDDIPILVNEVYSKEPTEFIAYYEEFQNAVYESQNKAKDFLLKKIDYSKYNTDLKGFSDISQNDCEAGVREGDETFEVIMVKASELDRTPTPERALEIAKKLIRLPRVLSRNATLKELENRTKQYGEWLKSPWLSGMLIMTLDETNKTELTGFNIKYSEEEGLVYERI